MVFLGDKLQHTHDRACDRLSWYRRWHEKSYHKQVHYAVAHIVGWPLVAVIIMSLVVTSASLKVIWSAQTVQAAGKTWTSYSDFAAWTQSSTVAKANGTIQLTASVGAPSSVATITGFTQPVDSAAANGMIYLADSSARLIQKINPATNTIVSAISLTYSPRKLILGSDGLLYIVAESSLYVINPATDALSGPYTIDAGGTGWSIAQAPNGNLYITNLSSNQVTVMNPTTHAVVRTIPAGAYERGITVGSDGVMYVTNANSNSMTVIDTTTDTVLATVTGLSNPNGVVIADDGYVYVVNSVGDTVVRVNPTTRAIDTTISVGSSPIAILKDTNSQLWVTNLLSNNVMRINPATNTITGTVATGNRPWGLGLGADGNIYVGSQTATTVTRVNTGTLSYTTSGSATTSYTPQADQLNTWSTATADVTTPASTSISLDYSSDGSSWQSNLASVPSSTTLYVRASFTGTTSATPTLNALTINYAAAESGGTGNTDQGNVANTLGSNTLTEATNEPSVANTAANSSANTANNEQPAAAVAKPQNVRLSAGPNMFTVSFDAPPAGHRVRIWRSLDAFSDGLLIESVDGTEFSEPMSTISAYEFGNPIYYYVDTFRLSDQKVSEKVGVSGAYPLEHFYSLSIGAHNITTKPGESQQLSATVYDQNGSPVDLPVTWTVTDAKIGTVSPTGLFTAGQQTGYWPNGLKASVVNGSYKGEMTVSASVDRAGSVVAGIYVGPNSATLLPGQTQAFAVYQIDQYGNYRAVADQSRATWRSTVGTMQGNTLTAGAQATLTNDGVTAVYTDESGRVWQASARVAISTEKPYLYRVYLSGPRRLSTGTSYQFSSAGYDQFSNYIGKNVTRTYRSDDTSVATIDSSGNLHVGSQVGCYPWLLRSDQTYDGRSDYSLAGFNTQPLTDAQAAKASQARSLAWRQVKYVFAPNETYQLAAYVYNGFSVQAPGEYVEFEMADLAAGSITSNGLFTAGPNSGTYKGAIKIYYVNTLTDTRRLGANFTLTISNEAPVLKTAKTYSLTTKSHSHGATSASLYDQYGYAYRGAFVYSWSLLGGNSEIRQNALVNTGAAESSPQVIDLSVTTASGQQIKAESRGSITSRDSYDLTSDCAVMGTTGTTTTAGAVAGDDGQLLYLEPASDETLVDVGSLGDQRSAKSLSDQAISSQKLLVPLTALAVLVTLPGLVSGVAQVLAATASRLGSGFVSVFQLIGLSRRNNGDGLVTDKRRRPVAGALVEILAPADRSVIESQRTDAQGRYAFLHAGPGAYMLRVSASGFDSLELRVRQQSIHRHISLGMSKDDNDRLLARHRRWSVVRQNLVWFSLAVLLVGTVSWFIIINEGGRGLLVMLMGAYYALTWLLQGLLLALPRPYGVVVDARSGQPISLTIVRVTDRRGRVVATEITDRKGRYRALLPSGTYDLTYSRPGYQPVVKHKFIVSRSSAAVGQQVKLTRPATDM